MSAQEKGLPFFCFFNFFFKLISNANLSKIKTFSEFGPKTEVVPNNFIYNFALMCNSKLEKDFEL